MACDFSVAGRSRARVDRILVRDSSELRSHVYAWFVELVHCGLVTAVL